MIIAVDFDGTLSLGARFPHGGRPNRELIAALNDATKNGHQVVLWTCRGGHDLGIATDWCESHGLSLAGVNENLRFRLDHDCRKIDADIYVDDRIITPQQFIEEPRTRARLLRNLRPRRRS